MVVKSPPAASRSAMFARRLTPKVRRTVLERPGVAIVVLVVTCAWFLLDTAFVGHSTATGGSHALSRRRKPSSAPAMAGPAAMDLEVDNEIEMEEYDEVAGFFYLPIEINNDEGSFAVLEHLSGDRWRYDATVLGNTKPLICRRTMDFNDRHSSKRLPHGDEVVGSVEVNEDGDRFLRVDQAQFGKTAVQLLEEKCPGATYEVFLKKDSWWCKLILSSLKGRPTLQVNGPYPWKAKQDAAQKVLDEPELMSLIEEASRNRKYVTDLKVGQEVEGVVKGFKGGVGAYIDIGFTSRGFLSAAEFRDGFPRSRSFAEQTDGVPSDASDVIKDRKITARVMKVDGKNLYLTRRSGDLSRPRVTALRFADNNVAQFEGVDEWLDADVVSITLDDVLLQVDLPGSPPTLAVLQPRDFVGDFQDTVALGSSTRVRVKRIDARRNKVYMSMKEASEEVSIADMKVGQTLSGEVKAWVKEKGIYIDVGADRDGYLPVGEFRDGFPNDMCKSELRVGKKVTVRVLSVAGGRLTLTRRSGDMKRPATMNPRENDVSGFLHVEDDEWLEGSVVALNMYAALVRISPPDGGQPVQAMLNSGDFADGFIDKIDLGSTVRVRVKDCNPPEKRLWLTMREQDQWESEDIQGKDVSYQGDDDYDDDESRKGEIGYEEVLI